MTARLRIFHYRKVAKVGTELLSRLMLKEGKREEPHEACDERVYNKGDELNKLVTPFSKALLC